MELFRRQSSECPPYRDYLAAIGVAPESVSSAPEIPYLPIEIFKTHRVYCGTGEPEAVFTSSGKSSSRHYVARLADYEKTFTRAFEFFYGDPAGWEIRSLLPCYQERGGSSLIYMVDGLQRKGLPDAPQRLLIGVSYALLDLAESGDQLPAGTIVMETGGMKGHREEMSKEQLHRMLCDAFGLTEIHSEYGMAELTSQAYSREGGIFQAPPWMRISVRDLMDPFDVRRPETTGCDNIRGGINIIDLANLHSCAFIQTQDVGRVMADGSFTIDGRIVGSDIRGCNLLVQ